MVVFLLTTAAEGSSPALHNNAADVIISYAQIASAPSPQRQALFIQASPSMKGDLWLMHLDNFLTDHEDLTPAQRSVIFEAMGMIASGLFEEADTSSLSARFEKPFELFTAHARAAFPKDLLGAAFATLGPVEIAAGRPRRPRLSPGINGLPIEPPGVPCGCNADHDFCDTITNPDYVCKLGAYHCGPSNRGCGWLWFQACNGLCCDRFNC